MGMALCTDEDRLPQVPLPTLDESCARFVAWCAPLLTVDQLATTKIAVASFQQPDSPARKLQAALEEYNSGDSVGSWLDSFWADRYLGRRDRIALNANFFLLLTNSGHDQVERAARLVAAVVAYKFLLDADRIGRVVDPGRGLSVEQNRFLFSTTRIPGRRLDSVRAPYSAAWPGPSRERHVVVFFRGSMFRMDVVGAHDRPYIVDELMAGFRAVMAHPVLEGRPPAPVGHLTTKPRAAWAESRHALLECDPRNADVLDGIETALFCVCLDETRPTNALEACDQLLHGDSANRWFDKSVSLIVFADGTAGLNVEHSCLDGSTMLDVVDAVVSAPSHDRSDRPRTRSDDVPPVEPIAFDVDADLRADVSDAAASFAAAAADTATAVLSLDEIGAVRAKQLRMSPDAFVQMAFQLAHKRVRRFVGSTYESISTRHFQHGRTEAMRVVTPEVIRFVHTMDDTAADEATRRRAFRAAAEKHVERTKECQAGQAPEQHLWELQLLQGRRGDELGVHQSLALYDTAGWLTMRDDYLSTSSLESTNVEYGGFGPTSSTCVGIAYMLRPDRLSLHVSTPRPVVEQMHRFIVELRHAVHELGDLLSGAHGE